MIAIGGVLLMDMLGCTDSERTGFIGTMADCTSSRKL